MFSWLFNKSTPADADIESGDAGQDIMEIETDTESQDRRYVPRKNVYADAVVLSHEGTCVNKAILLDISESGARLRFTNNAEIEGALWVKIGRFRLEVEALPVWRSRTDVGVEFLF